MYQKILICDNIPLILCDNMIKEMTEEEKKKRFLEKHPPLSDLKTDEELVKDPDTGKITKQKVSFASPQRKPKTIEEAWKEQDKAKKKYESNIQKVEENLLDFLKVEDPIIYNEKVLAWMRRPSNKEIRKMIPKELMEYEDKPATEIPDEILEKYDKKIYSMMAELITKPKWTAEEWTNKTNPWFTRLFWDHITNIIRMTQAEIAGF